MKTITLLGLLLLGAATLNGCRKKETVKPLENPLSSYMSSESTINSGVRTSGPWELGVVFSVSTAGKLTQVGSKMPEPGSYRVIVWDFDTKQLLRQKTVEQTAGNVLALNDIEALPLTANKKYVISVNSRSSGVDKKYAFAYKTGFSEFMPFTKGSVLVHNACYTFSAPAVFPSGVQNIKYEFYGYPEFTFVTD